MAKVCSYTSAAVGAGSGDQGPLDLGPGGGASRVDDAGLGMAALPGEGQLAAGLPVEDSTEGDQLVDPAGALVDQHPDGGRVAEVGAGLEGVGDVQVEGVGVLVEHRGHAPLRPTGRGLVERALGQQAHAEAHGARGPYRGRQACHSTPEDQEVQLGRHRPRTLRPSLSGTLPGQPGTSRAMLSRRRGMPKRAAVSSR